MKRFMFMAVAMLALAGPAVEAVQDHAIPYLVSQIKVPGEAQTWGSGAMLALMALAVFRKRINWKKIGFTTKEYAARALNPIAWLATVGFPLYIFNNITDQVNGGGWSQDLTKQGLMATIGLVMLHTLRNKGNWWLGTHKFKTASDSYSEQDFILAKAEKATSVAEDIWAPVNPTNNTGGQVSLPTTREGLMKLGENMTPAQRRDIVLGMIKTTFAKNNGNPPNLENNEEIKLAYTTEKGHGNWTTLA